MPPSPVSARSWGAAAGLVLVVSGVLLLGLALNEQRHRSSPKPSSLATTTPTRGTTPPAPRGFSPERVTFTDEAGHVVERCLLLALTEAQRQQGLMRVTDPTLGGFDGMLFAFDAPAVDEFWMRDTPLPLSVAFFDEGGRFVSSADMSPCPSTAATCPTYAAKGPYTTAVEVPRGRLAASGIRAGTRVRRTRRACPAT